MCEYLNERMCDEDEDEKEVREKTTQDFITRAGRWTKDDCGRPHLKYRFGNMLWTATAESGGQSTAVDVL